MTLVILETRKFATSVHEIMNVIPKLHKLADLDTRVLDGRQDDAWSFQQGYSIYSLGHRVVNKVL